VQYPTTNANFIFFSDVHLGSDLVQHVRPWTVSRLKQMARIDRDLAAMLDHYRTERDPERPWRLVIAGDLVDFIGMNIAPAQGSELWAHLNAEERELGLGSTEEMAAAKMRAVAERHSHAFTRLAAFVAEGNSLVLVRGNHDVDFHWQAARSAFVEALRERAPEGASLEGFEDRIEFCPLFYYEEHLFYVEHGHQFDPMCSYHYPLEPVSPLDPRRISWAFSDILLRFVCRPTPGLSSEGHDGNGFMHYLGIAWSLGFRGGARLFYRYVRAIARAVRGWWSHLGEGASKIRDAHERNMKELAQQKRIGLERLKALSALWPAPITRELMGVFRSVFVDRIVGAALLTLIVTAAFVFLPLPWAIGAAIFAATLCVAYLWRSARRRVHDVEPEPAMRRAARKIAELFPTRFVVMGHTHVPRMEALDAVTTYVNLGGWAVDDLDGHAHEAPRTHLVIRWIDGEPVARLYRWKTGLGPLLCERSHGASEPVGSAA
jgi:UDP-2,3-diacylglucosamine pyrophosphatase LpxH